MFDQVSARRRVRYADHPRSRVRTVGSGLVTGSAFLLVWIALVAPSQIATLTPRAFIRIPLEGLILIAVVLVLPRRMGRPFAALVGVGLGVLTLFKVLDLGFSFALDRPFDPMTDVAYLGPAVGLLSDSVGRPEAIAAFVAAAVLGAALLVVMPMSVLRLTRSASRRRPGSLLAVAVGGVIWAVCAVSGVQAVPGVPIASTSAAGLLLDHVHQVRAGIEDQATVSKAAADDPWRHVRGNDLLTGLRGKDVIIAFVESYGRVAVQGSAFSGQVDSALDAGTAQLRSAGFLSRSAFLTSPTFGGISWLAHSTLQSGLWIDNQQRYDDLVTSDRFTLSDAFRRAGWRTVSVVPSDHHGWPQGKSFYHYDRLYDTRNLGYDGPAFSYATMPDQYIMSAFQRLELAKPHHAPVMAEIDLVSSHTPWAPLPHMIRWSRVGDGSVYNTMAAHGPAPDVIWRNPDQVRSAYGRSVQYSLDTLVSFVRTYGDKNLVLILLGDHQPAAIVTGEGASHDVPITIIAHDPAVISRIAGWGWQPGMRPGPDAPVWPMNAFRNRFLTAYGPKPAATPTAAARQH
jgi:hypothetical protein